MFLLALTARPKERPCCSRPSSWTCITLSNSRLSSLMNVLVAPDCQAEGTSLLLPTFKADMHHRCSRFSSVMSILVCSWQGTSLLLPTFKADMQLPTFKADMDHHLEQLPTFKGVFSLLLTARPKERPYRTSLVRRGLHAWFLCKRKNESMHVMFKKPDCMWNVLYAGDSRSCCPWLTSRRRRLWQFSDTLTQRMPPGHCEFQVVNFSV